ncbi:MAG: hypothetical protein GWN00_27875, partial [Aliifodinibius sp.]|nr:hypothetical protein [Fodinibius sp.]NIV14624.1 hypothetical protein [Fodinibius sp.]NIY28483.1 hypothetical protein [Fodinibius sp.]
MESVSDLQFGPPRIAGLWDDLDPSAAGTVSTAIVGPDFVVTFNNVPEFDSTNSNSLSITLRSDGTFTFDYQSIDVTDGLVGNSPGNGHGGDPGEIDLSTEPEPIGGSIAAMVYELFDADDNDLSGDNLDFAACPALLGPPDINISPIFFTFTLPQGVVTTDVLTISNTAQLGSEALNWQITDQEVVLRLNDGRELPARINGGSN